MTPKHPTAVIGPIHWYRALHLAGPPSDRVLLRRIPLVHNGGEPVLLYPSGL